LLTEIADRKIMSLFGNSSHLFGVNTTDTDGGVHRTKETDLNPSGAGALMSTIYNIAFYSIYIPVAFGFPGNILIILVGTMGHNKKRTTSVYMVGLAIPDVTLVLLEGIGIEVWRRKAATFWPSRELEAEYV
jgi:hypothetical protein